MLAAGLGMRGTAAAAAILIAHALTGQGFDPQEIRLSSAPYLPRGGFALKAETRLVDVGVVVRDDRGHAIAGLTKDDFQVSDDGKRHAITAFSIETFVASGAAPALPLAGGAAPSAAASLRSKPRFVALFFDDLSMPPDDLYHSKTAGKSFLKSGLAASDRVAVLTTSKGMTLPFTGDTAALAAAIDRITVRQSRHDSIGCPALKEYDAYLIANHLDNTELDVKAQEYANCSNICPASRSRRGSAPAACQQAYQQVQAMSGSIWEQVRSQSLNTIRTLQNVVDMMAGQDGARMVLLASSGFLSGTLEFDQDEVIERALRANVVIDSLDAKGLYTEDPPEFGMGATVRSAIQQQLLGTRPKEDANSALGNLADSTGGLFFHNSNDLDLGFRELGMQPEVSYLLGFVPDPPDGRYHHLKVTLANRRRERVQARLGYMASATPPPAALPERAIDREVSSGREANDFPVRIEAQAGKLDNGMAIARLALICDPAKMSFRTENGVHTQSLDIISVLLDAKGGFIAGKEGTVRFALKDPTYQRLVSDGLKLSMSIEAPAGAYRLRTIVSAEDDPRISAQTQSLELK